MIAFLTVAAVVFAQHVGSNSPYSRYGYGLLSNPAFGASEAMGGISYGLRRSQQVNPGNPASYSEIDSLTFIFDMGYRDIWHIWMTVQTGVISIMAILII